MSNYLNTSLKFMNNLLDRRCITLQKLVSEFKTGRHIRVSQPSIRRKRPVIVRLHIQYKHTFLRTR